MDSIIIDIIEEDYERAKKCAKGWPHRVTKTCLLAQAASRVLGQPVSAGYVTLVLADGSEMKATDEEAVRTLTHSFGEWARCHRHNNKPWPPFRPQSFEFRPVEE
jgi:hypothetical protein